METFSFKQRKVEKGYNRKCKNGYLGTFTGRKILKESLNKADKIDMIYLGICRSKLHTFFILFFSLMLVFSAHAQEFNEQICKDELSKKMRALIKADDGEIIIQASNIAALKLNYKLLNAGSEKQTLEDHVKKHLKKLSSKDKKHLIDKVKKLYEEYGENQTTLEVNEILDGLTKHNYFPRAKRLSNKESAVIMLAYEIIDPDQGEMKINEQDVAITWFMDEVYKKAQKGVKDSAITNRLKTSVKVAHTAGVFKQTGAMNKFEIMNELYALEKKYSSKMKTLIKDFSEEFNFCFSLLGGEACIKNTVNDVYTNSLADITRELKKNSLKEAIVDGEGPRIKLMDTLSLNLKGSIISKESYTFKSVEAKGAKSEINPPALPSKKPKFVSGEAPNTCGGLQYESEVRNLNMHTVDPLRFIGMSANGAGSGKFSDPLNSKIRDNTKFGQFLTKICPKGSLGPFNFKCYPFVKLFNLTKKSAEVKVCCEDKIDWVSYQNNFLSFTGGVEIKAYYGLPDYIPFLVLEVGFLGGATLTYAHGGGDMPEGCGEKKCKTNTVRLSVYGGVYGDAGVSKDKWGLNGRGQKSASRAADRMPAGVGFEGKFTWRPHATVRECTYPNGITKNPEITLSGGKAYINFTVYVGWIYQYNKNIQVWDDKNKTTTFDLPIF